MPAINSEYDSVRKIIWRTFKEGSASVSDIEKKISDAGLPLQVASQITVREYVEIQEGARLVGYNHDDNSYVLTDRGKKQMKSYLENL